MAPRSSASNLGQPASSGPRADAIVVAAGSSTRMGGTDKLAAEIAGRPLLGWTLAAIAAAPEVERIVVVAAAGRMAELSSAPWLPGKQLIVVAGGARRHESVHAGLLALDRSPSPDPDGGADRVVLVHDGARPLVQAGLVSAVARAAFEHGAAIPVVPLAETVKRLADGVVAETIDRSSLGAAQTPQGARRSLLRAAFERFPPSGPETWTDEAALLEACNIPVHAIAGQPSNLKVTAPGDLSLVEAVLGSPARSRYGLGVDVHPFGPGEPLVLGGVPFPGVPRLAGHSDGDVVLHAVADALLGAAGLGDLGRLFPADERTPRGIASGGLLEAVVGRLAEAGLRPAGVDVTIVGSRPRLADRLDEVRDRMAELLGLPPSVVSVKASTGNLAGMEGAGRGLSAQAIAVVEAVR